MKAIDHEVDLRKHRGRFVISDPLLLSPRSELFQLFARVIVLEATRRWEFYRTEYYALSPDFDESEEGCLVPVYEPQFTIFSDDTGHEETHFVGWRKVEPQAAE